MTRLAADFRLLLTDINLKLALQFCWIGYAIAVAFLALAAGLAIRRGVWPQLLPGRIGKAADAGSPSPTFNLGMRWRLGIILAVGGLAIGSVWLFEHPNEGFFTSEPSYHGHSLSYWMDNRYTRLKDGGSFPNPEADDAFEAIGTNAIPYLVEWISSSRRAQSGFDYSWKSLEILRRMGPSAAPAIPGLIRIVGEDGNFPACALGAIGTNAIPAVSAALLESVSTTNSPAKPRGRRRGRPPQECAQRNLVGALGFMGTNAEPAVPALIAYLDNNMALDRGGAAEALAVIGRNQPDFVVPALLRALGQLKGFSRGCVADALGSFGTNAKIALPALDAASHDSDPYVQIHAAAARDQIEPGNPEAIRSLIEHLATGPPLVRRQAIGALSRVGKHSSEALTALSECLHDADPQIRIEAERGIREIGSSNDRIISGLRDNLDHNNSFVADEAASTLAILAAGSEPAFIALLRGPSSPQRSVQQQSKYRLVEAARTHPKFLVAGMNDSDPKVRYNALATLYDLQDAVSLAVPALVRLLADPDPEVRSRATNVLWVQDPRAARSAGINRP